MSGAPGDPRRLADALVAAARTELELTPKPGLVDRKDSGSHPDLSFDAMSRSIDLLPRYFGDLLALAAPPGGPLDLDACVAAGRDAEARMAAEVGCNAHRGYIFLSGLVLLSYAAGGRSRTTLPGAVAGLAARVLAPQRPGAAETHGAALRGRYGVGGIHAEVLAGLPSVFHHGLPALERGLAAFGPVGRAHHYLMATLMTVVEDTTALHRCGPAGLERLRHDGRRLCTLIERGDDCVSVLEDLNARYRAMRLTLGGVADCMAITLALHDVLRLEG